MEIGTPFNVEVDTLNYEAGTWYFMTAAAGEAVYDSVEITEPDPQPAQAVRDDMTVNNRAFAIYDSVGSLLAAHDTSGPPVVLAMGNVYILAVNLNLFQRINNRIQVNFFDSGGLNLQKEDILRIKVLREYDLEAVLAFEGTCPGDPVDRTAIPGGVAVIRFRTPGHQKYYEYDGQLHFHVGGTPAGGSDCSLVDYSIEVDLDDPAAAPAIPDFEAYNSTRYPGQPWRNDFPFDRRHIRIVRWGDRGLTTPGELWGLAAMVTDAFPTATKGYFRLEVEGVEQFPLVQPFTELRVVNWYQNVPKTAGRPALDLTDPDQLWLATLLYYYEHPEDVFVGDMTSLYSPGSTGEDLTIYVFDGPGAIGQAMGEVASRVKKARLYPAFVFYEGDDAGRTYHFDLAACSYCGSTASEYLDYLAGDKSPVEVASTIVHELGHTCWMARAGVSTGDLGTRYLPFRSDYVYEDDSIGFFTRFEYMSYGRNRSTLDGLSYGDAYLEQVLAAYAQPTSEVRFVSHAPNASNVVNVGAGETVTFDFAGKAGSGLRMLWYFNESSPVPLDYGTPERADVFVYDTNAPRTHVDTKQISITLSTPGTYVYRFRSRSRLYPIVWQPHQSTLGTFAIQVA